MISLNFSNYFEYFVFNTNSLLLSASDRKLAKMASILFGLITLGLGLVLCRALKYKKNPSFLEKVHVVRDKTLLKSNSFSDIASSLKIDQEKPDNKQQVIAPFVKVKPTFETAKQELERGIEIPKEALEIIRTLMPKILKEEKDSEIKWLSCNNNNRVFSLIKYPQYVFKVPFANSIDKKLDIRFENMIKGQLILMEHGLNFLVIPHAKTFTLEVEKVLYSFIVEERLDIDPLPCKQRDLYREKAKDLNEAIRQLMIFLAKLRLRDLDWGNISILEDSRFALVDFDMVFNGKFLIVVNELMYKMNEHLDLIIEEAEKHGISSLELSEIKKWILIKKERIENIERFHTRRGIVKGDEPIIPDIKALGLDLTQMASIDGKDITLEQFATESIQLFEREISKRSHYYFKEERRVIICYQERFPSYFVLPENEKEESKKWLYQIVKALKDRGYIFDFTLNHLLLEIQA